MRDVISGHEGSQQMGNGTGLTAVRPEHERVHPPLSAKQKIITSFSYTTIALLFTNTHNLTVIAKE